MSAPDIHRREHDRSRLDASCRVRGTLTGRGDGRQVGSRHHVYVILLWDVRGAGRSGLYVGQTSRDPDWRFDQHKSGYKASSAARRFGVRLLPTLVAHLNPMMGWESLDIEATLADAFRASGVPWVEGGH